jgi:hypothetical protein
MIRKGIEPVWKIFPFLIFGFYLWFHRNLFPPVWNNIQADYVNFLMKFIPEFGKAIFYLLPYIWMVIFVTVFYMVDEAKAEKLMKFMVFLTIVIWLFWLANHFFGEKLAPFLKREVPKFLP